MPQAVAGWVTMTFISLGASATVAAVAGAIAAWAVVIATPFALASLSRALYPTPKMLNSLTTEYTGTVEPRRIIYGEMRASGMNVIPPIVSGSEGQFLHQVLAVAGHEVDSITDVWFNQTLIASANIAAIASSESSGNVTSGTFANIANIRRYTGTATQSVDWLLDSNLSTSWGTDHTGRGIAYVAVRFKYDKEKYAPIGKPDVTCLIRGKKVYDPRLDTTNGGSGSHRYTDPTTWAWSDNPALCLADYLMDDALGLGEDPARIDWVTVAAAANECDEVVSIPGAATQKRYTCNVILSATDKFEDNIEILTTAMLGHCVYSGGRWQIHAGGWSASAFDLTEADIVGQVSIQTDTPRNQKYNAVRGQFYDAGRDYQPAEFQPRTDAAYEAADGERIWREVDFRAVTNEYRAQRNAIILLRRSRNRRIVTADFSMAAFKVKPWETGTLTLSEIGWTAKPVRCVAWEFRPEGTVRLTLQEEASTDWSDPVVGAYTTVTAVTPPTGASYTPPAPTSLTATPVTGGVLLSWGGTSFLAPGGYYEVYRHTAASPFSSATVIATTYGNTYLDVGVEPKAYYYWVKAVSANVVRSTEYPSGNGVSAYGISLGYVTDPDFRLSAGAFGSYWSHENGNNYITTSISSSGGIGDGGKVSITFTNAGAESRYFYVKRQPPNKSSANDVLEVLIRWRRTGTIADGGTELYFGPAMTSATAITADGVADGTVAASEYLAGPLTTSSSSPGLDRAAMNARTVNQWQTDRWAFRLYDNSTSFPYLSIYVKVYQPAGTNSGTIEIATIDVVRGSQQTSYTVPQLAKTSGYTLTRDDIGRHISITTGGITVPAGVFHPGDAVTVYNNSGSSQTITQGASTTLYLAGTATTGNRTLAQRGVCTILCTGTDVFTISGAGVT